MPVSNVEYTTLINRLASLENQVNQLTTAVSKLVSLDQVTQLGLLRQTEIDQLDTRVDALEAQVEALESYHKS